MTEWDATSYEGKDTILRVVRNEAENLFAMAEKPEAWDSPTACESWTVMDIVGHLIDTTEGYFAAFDTARSGAAAPSAYGLAGMHEQAGEQAMALRNLSQKETMDRVRGDLDKMMGILEPLSAEEWTGFIVPHFYMGPLPRSSTRPASSWTTACIRGTSAGHRCGARHVGRCRRPAGAVHVRAVAVDDQARR